MSENRAVAYILKGFPRLSETFIASEIYRLEQLGTDLRIFVIKPSDEAAAHSVVGKIAAVPFYLPKTTSLSHTGLFQWLGHHFGDFSSALTNVVRRRPVSALRAAAFTFAQAVRARKGFWATLRKVYVKEFLQAAVIAEQVLKDSSVGHLHAHFAHGAATVARMAALMTGKTFSFTAHAKDIYLESLNPAGLLKRKMDAAEFVVTCTKANRRHLSRLSVTPVHCIYHGLSSDFASLTKKGNGRGRERSNELKALAVGRLVPKKGFDSLVRACGILQTRGVRFSARIVGESGEHEPELRRLIEVYGLREKVRLVGAMTQDKLILEYQNADLFCLPCRVLGNGDRDGIPNVLVEAMSCGLPVISTDISGIPEIITDGKNGVLVGPEKPLELADAMCRVFTDLELSRKISAAGRRTVNERFDGGTSAVRLARLFKNLGCLSDAGRGDRAASSPGRLAETHAVVTRS